VLLDGLVVSIKGRFKEEDGGDASSHFLDVANFIFCEWATEERLFAVRKPFLDDLIAADCVFPYPNLDARREHRSLRAQRDRDT